MKIANMTIKKIIDTCCACDNCDDCKIRQFCKNNLYWLKPPYSWEWEEE